MDAGLPPTALLDTPAGPLGAIGLAHPDGHRFTPAPPVADDWGERVVAPAADLRRDDPWWNWCRLPAAVSASTADPASVALVAGNVRLLSDRLNRELTVEPSPVPARDALPGLLTR